MGFITIDVDYLLYIAGVAIGAGWQAMVAYMNIGSYLIVGIPLGLLLGFKYDMGVRVCLLFLMIFASSNSPKCYN